MTKNMMKDLVKYLNGETIANIAEIKASLEAEIAKGEEKANANRALYASAHDVVMGVMSEKPMTVAEIFDNCSVDLPEGFSKSKVQYALTNYWKDEVIKVENPKGANEYRKA